MSSNATKRQEAKAKLSPWLQIQTLLNNINHILIGLVATYMTALGRSLSFKDTAMHAFLTTIGFHVLMAEALMCHYPINFVTTRFSHRAKSRIHGILQLMGGSMALLGALGKISSTDLHFKTLHGKFGLAATFMCLASLLGGIVNYFQPKFAHKLYPPSEIKYRHNLFGMVTFTLGMITIYLGYSTQFFIKYVDNDFIPAISIATILVFVLTMTAPMLSILDKLKYRNKRK